MWVKRRKLVRHQLDWTGPLLPRPDRSPSYRCMIAQMDNLMYWKRTLLTRHEVYNTKSPITSLDREKLLSPTPSILTSTQSSTLHTDSSNPGRARYYALPTSSPPILSNCQRLCFSTGLPLSSCAGYSDPYVRPCRCSARRYGQGAILPSSCPTRVSRTLRW